MGVKGIVPEGMCLSFCRQAMPGFSLGFAAFLESKREWVHGGIPDMPSMGMERLRARRENGTSCSFMKEDKVHIS